MSGISYFAGRCSQQLIAHHDGLAQTATRSMATAMRPCMHSRPTFTSRRSVSHLFTSTSASTGVAAALGWPVLPLHLQRKVAVWSRAYNAEEAIASSDLPAGPGALSPLEVGTLVINPNLGTVEVELSNGTGSAAHNGVRPAQEVVSSNGTWSNGYDSVEPTDVASTSSNGVATAVDTNGTTPVAAAEVVLDSSAAVAEETSCGSNVSDTTILEAAEGEAAAEATSSDSSIPATGSNSDVSTAESASRSSSGPVGPPIRLLFQSGAAMLPHPDKAHRGGEDSFFIADHQSAIGVADGVGGWAEIGVDAGAYARLLMVHAKEAADAAAEHVAAGTLSAQQILETAFYKTNVQGSSTACVLVVNGITLSASNLGDSGFVLVRDGVATFQSPQQQHNFNFPFQLGSADSMSDQPQAAMVSKEVSGTSSMRPPTSQHQQ
eukprot:GHUV01009103.1.p1 GENE.GHUV01009103.1~~GHUV01009103.1.p1  ORF type:complete len:488 (+),score=119.48 GHUV01009103.1:162-1466(+)